jgi:hypothetical protein
MAANLNISIGATIEPLKKAISAVMQTMSQFSQTLGANGEQLRNQIDSAMAEVDQQLKAATSSFENFGKSGKSSTDKSTEAFVPLRRQLREATIEFQRLADKNGLASKEATEAAKRVAELKDQMGDMNDVVNAMHPDSKFNGLRNVLVNAVGGVQALGGAMTLFAGESEQTTQTIAKLQSIMAISAGLNQIGGLADSFKALKIQIASATAGMSTMKVVLASIGIGALIAAVSLLAANWESVSEALSDASVKTERLAEESKKAQEELKKAIEERGRIEDERFAKETKYISASFDRKIKEVSQEIALANARKAGASEIYALTVKQLQIEKDKAAALDKYSLKDLSWLKLGMKFRENMADADFKMKEAAIKYHSDVAEAAKESNKKILADRQKMFQKWSAQFDTMDKAKKSTAEAMASISASFTAAATPIQRKSKLLLDDATIIAEYIKKVAKANEYTNVFGTEQEKLSSKIEDTKAAIQAMLADGISPQDDKVVTLTNNLKSYNAQLHKVGKESDFAKSQVSLLNNAVKDLAVNGFVALGEAMGNAMAGKGNVLQNLFKSMGMVVADFLGQIGKGLIATAISIEAFKKAFTNPYAAVAAGVAAIALGQLLKSKLQAGPSFAVGSWEIPNDMNANIHKGEMIIPRTFADDIRNNKGFGGGRVAVEGLIYGNNLAVISRKTNNRNMRIRGQWG